MCALARGYNNWNGNNRRNVNANNEPDNGLRMTPGLHRPSFVISNGDSY